MSKGPGRKGYAEELHHIKVLMCCEQILYRALLSPKVSEEEKRKIALQLYAKSIPTNFTIAPPSHDWFEILSSYEKAVNGINPKSTTKNSGNGE
ncbi:MAG: hypothetical protein QME51_04195 [Planctomycetota bacterium]|nr:hypothetical protein [Planctomycetota bacterium]